VGGCGGSLEYASKLLHRAILVVKFPPHLEEKTKLISSKKNLDRTCLATYFGRLALHGITLNLTRKI